MGYNQSDSGEAKAVYAIHDQAELMSGRFKQDGSQEVEDTYTELANGIKMLGKLAVMKKHPNYQQQVPLPGETLVQFSLRWAAHLISPPQQAEESYDLECIDVAAAIQHLAPEIEAAWAAHTR